MRISDLELRKLTVVMEDKNLSFAQVLELIENSNIQSKKVIDVSGVIILSIDYANTVRRAVAAGNYDNIDHDINAENFPILSEMIGKKVDVSAKLFHFNQDISSEDVAAEIDQAGYRPATLMELLALGFLYPELQRQSPVVALGSTWFKTKGYGYVPTLGINSSSRRRLSLCSRSLGNWPVGCLFLAVRK